MATTTIGDSMSELSPEVVQNDTPPLDSTGTPVVLNEDDAFTETINETITETVTVGTTVRPNEKVQVPGLDIGQYEQGQLSATHNQVLPGTYLDNPPVVNAAIPDAADIEVSTVPVVNTDTDTTTGEVPFPNAPVVTDAPIPDTAPHLVDSNVGNFSNGDPILPGQDPTVPTVNEQGLPVVAPATVDSVPVDASISDGTTVSDTPIADSVTTDPSFTDVPASPDLTTPTP